MARTYPVYMSIGTTKYGVTQYGSGWKYGINFPPPVPEDLAIAGDPPLVDGVAVFDWPNPTFSWTVSIGDNDLLLYELQISFEDITFASPIVDTTGFSASDLTYTLASVYTLTESGMYYARMRSTDGYTASDWSDILTFVVYLYSPYPPTIDPVTSPADGFWQVITGTKATKLHVFIRNNGGEWTEVSYPGTIDASLWRYNMPLVSGTNYIEVIATPTSYTEVAPSIPVGATIYLIVSIPEVYNIWNCFDEFGLLLGLSRIPEEKNYDYKLRLLDVYVNPANSTYVGLRNGISRELGIDASGIEIERLSDLMDPTYADNLLNSDGHALGTKLVDYADEVYDHNPIFFGNIICDESYWDGVDEETNGYNFLPHIWDPTPSGILDKWQCGGIGDNDDLWVNDLIEIWNPNLEAYSWYLPIHTGYFYSVYPSGVIGA